MGDHRIRLDDSEVLLVVAALTARAAGLTGARRAKARQLARRLMEGIPGNPEWIGTDGAAAASARTARAAAAARRTLP